MNAQFLLERIDATIAAKQDQTGRRHLGASLIGHECGRFLFYSFRWAAKEQFSGRMLRLFERGQLEESRFVRMLRDVGATVYETDPGTGEQWRISDIAGHFGGSCDGVAIDIPQLPDGHPALLEMKTHGSKSFATLKSKGLQSAKPQHFVQMQTYMFKMSIATGLYMAVNKDTDELYFEFIALDPAVGMRAIERARMIIFGNEPPPRIKNSVSWFPCNFCSMAEICHLNKVPSVNCRTCCHATPVEGGQWSCAKGQSEITTDHASGCGQHLFNPHLLNIAQIKCGNTDENWLTLIRKDGTEVTTGPDHVTSHELTL